MTFGGDAEEFDFTVGGGGTPEGGVGLVFFVGLVLGCCFDVFVVCLALVFWPFLDLLVVY
jgi:hypothetical protein